MRRTQQLVQLRHHATRLYRLEFEDGDEEKAEMKDRIAKIEREVQQINVVFSKQKIARQVLISLTIHCRSYR